MCESAFKKIFDNIKKSLRELKNSITLLNSKSNKNSQLNIKKYASVIDSNIDLLKKVIVFCQKNPEGFNKIKTCSIELLNIIDILVFKCLKHIEDNVGNNVEAVTKAGKAVTKAGKKIDANIKDLCIYFEPVAAVKLDDNDLKFLKKNEFREIFFTKFLKRPCFNKREFKINNKRTDLYVIRLGYRSEIEKIKILNVLQKQALKKLFENKLDKELQSTKNIHDFYKTFRKKVNSDIYKDWFYQFANMLNLLVDSGIDEAQMAELIKYSLMQYQFNATYGIDDCTRLFRQTSPIVLDGYGRGIRTGLWGAAQIIRKNQINNELKTLFGKNVAITKKYHILPVYQPYKLITPQKQIINFEVLDSLPKGILSKDNIYIKKYGVQIIKMDPTGNILKLMQLSESKLKQKIDKDLGAQGLRLSPSDSAKICSEYFAKLINQKNVKKNKGVEAVIGIIKKMMQLQTKIFPLNTRNILDQLKLHPNTLLVSLDYDPNTKASVMVHPLINTSQSVIIDLNKTYNEIITKDNDPFFVIHNIKVIKKMIGVKPMIFDLNTPEVVTIKLLDILEQITLLLDRMRSKTGLTFNDSATTLLMKDAEDFKDVYKVINALPYKGYSSARKIVKKGIKTFIAVQYRIEKFYQLMQEIHHLCRFRLSWQQAEKKDVLVNAIKNALPTEAPIPQCIITTAHGLSLFPAIRDSLKSSISNIKTGILKGAYYETPELFPGATMFDSVSATNLKTMNVIILEPHPNNAAEISIHTHDVGSLLNNLYQSNPGAHTVVLDLTLNHIQEKEVQDIFKKAKEYINSGKLNLIILQSGTKFLQHGMDIVNLGLCMVFNNNEGSWKTFNEKINKFHHPLPFDDQKYMAKMLNKELMQDLELYMNKIRKNTNVLRNKLKDLIKHDNAFCLCKTDDKATCYVAFRPTDFIITEISEITQDDLEQVEGLLKKEETLTTEEKKLIKKVEESREKVNKFIYTDHLIPKLKKHLLPSVDRTSFGFNITNFGECKTTIRVTLGIEEESLIILYGEIICEVGKLLYKKREYLYEELNE